MHGVDGVGEYVVIWVEPDLFFSVANAFWSPKVLKFYNQYPERPGISTVCFKSAFPKAIERRMFQNSVPAIPTFILIFLFWWRETWQRNENFDWSFLVTNGEKLKTTSTFCKEKNFFQKRNCAAYVWAKYYFCENIYKWKCYSVQYFHFLRQCFHFLRTNKELVLT